LATEIATELEQRVAESINAERSAEGLGDLKVEVHLNAAAQDQSEWMADTGELTHEGENGSDVTERVDEAGFPLSGAWRTTENVAFTSISGDLDEDDVDRMHQGLMDSPAHRENILDPDVSYVGIGLSVGAMDIGGQSQEVAFLTEAFAETDGRTLVQEEDADGVLVLQPYLDGEPVGEAEEIGAPPDEDEDEDKEEPDAGSGGCFVATAAYGGHAHPDVVALRRLRDEILVKHRAGRVFARTYRIVGPRLARFVVCDGRSGGAARAVLAPVARLAGGWVDRRE
jgi:hypothetical protein